MEITKFKNGNVPTFSGLLDEFFNKEVNLLEGSSLAKTVPAVNIRETEDKFILELAAPGVNKENFNIEVTSDNYIKISSEITENKESNNEKGRFTLREFSYNSFSRSFKLPDTVDGDKINANYKDGLLEITLPKKAEALPKPPRVIKIK
jgi:HSP20 family protein